MERFVLGILWLPERNIICLPETLGEFRSGQHGFWYCGITFECTDAHLVRKRDVWRYYRSYRNPLRTHGTVRCSRRKHPLPRKLEVTHRLQHSQPCTVRIGNIWNVESPLQCNSATA